MKKLFGIAILLSTAVGVAGIMQAAAQAPAPTPQEPTWAYAIPPAPPPGSTPPAPVNDDGKMLTVQGSDKQFTFNQVRGRLNNETPARIAPADWFPGDHPTMPKIVAEGDNARGIIACSLCHYPNGKGRAENASPQGLNKEYMIRTMHNMRNDLRASAERRKNNTQVMVGFTKAMTDAEIEEAATYFASMTWTPWIKVVESATAPKVRSQAGLWIPLTGADAGNEPIGNRIIEVPDNAMQTETLRNPRGMFTAYVPVGSVAKGKELASTGGGKTTACVVCHGADLNGIGSVPALAARSPSYLARQLNDFRQGARKGDMNEIMRAVAVKLDNTDILNLAAYTASLPAPSQGAPGTAAR